ncbi:MAG: PucR family transcriptional regulator, purine catabolism regulatory protein [Sphingomonadales bacterium]|nr:PucR family transcriptional regulator, purine catabolism regulatory protein [Sphingomonadales bacterium]
MPLVTVSELLRLALPPTTELVAGAAGSGNAVTWARLLRARPANLGRIEQGEVWLVSAAALQLVGDGRSIARMIREMAQAGVVAFVTPEVLGAEVHAEADAAGTPLLRVPNETSLSEIEKAIVSVLVDRDRAIGQRVQEVYERLLSTLVEDRGLELISNIVAEVTGKAVYLLDEHFQPTLQTGGGERAAEALADIRRRYWEGLLGNVSERLIVVRSSATVAQPTAVALRPLTLRGAVEGDLALLGPADDFVDFDHQVADRAASVLAIELAKQSAVDEARLRLQGDSLTELLDSPTPPEEPLLERARRLGYDLSRPHLVFVLRPREVEPRNGNGPPRGQQRFVDATRRRLVLADVTTLLREHDGSIQVLMPCPAELDPSDADASVAWVERLRSSLEESLAPDAVAVVAGVGRTPGADTTAYAAMREATRAADIAASMAGDSPAALHFARLGALRLIFHLADNPELRAFQRDVLGPLEMSDSARRSEFVRTLDAFLRAGGNHMRAARDLNVHRNTLIYRLERIQELLGGANLEDPEMRLNVQLALKIRAALGGNAP